MDTLWVKELLRHFCQQTGYSRIKMIGSSRSTLQEKLALSQRQSKLLSESKKNRQNGQSITLVSNGDHLNLCPIQAADRILLQANRLGQTRRQTLAVYVNKLGATKYLTGNKISEVLCSIARIVHPDLSKDEIKRFSSHLD